MGSDSTSMLTQLSSPAKQLDGQLVSNQWNDRTAARAFVREVSALGRSWRGSVSDVSAWRVASLSLPAIDRAAKALSIPPPPSCPPRVKALNAEVGHFVL